MIYEIIKFSPLVLARAGGVLCAIYWGRKKRNDDEMNEYHRKRGDIL